MLIGSSNCSSGARSLQPLAIRVAAVMGDLLEREGAGIVAADLDHRPQRRQPCGVQFARMGRRQFGRQRVDHADIVAGLEARRGDQRLAADLVQRVFDLGQAVGGVDVDQDQPGLGGGVLGDDPLGVVRRPDADAIAGLQPKGDKAGGEGIDVRRQFRPCPVDALLADDQAGTVAEAGDGAVEMDPDRVADHRLVRGAVHVAGREVGHRSAPWDGLVVWPPYCLRTGRVTTRGFGHRRKDCGTGLGPVIHVLPGKVVGGSAMTRGACAGDRLAIAAPMGLRRLGHLPRPIDRDVYRSNERYCFIGNDHGIDLHPLVALVLVVLGDPGSHVQRVADMGDP